MNAVLYSVTGKLVRCGITTEGKEFANGEWFSIPNDMEGSGIDPVEHSGNYTHHLL
jgi:hypothetical protein